MSDVVPAASAKNEYTDGAIEKLLSDGFREKLHGAEFNIVNLECPLTRENEPAAKWGSSLKALPESMEALKKIPGLVVNLANNHIRDYGSQGVLDTIQVLEEHGIPYLGAGKDMENSNRSLILEKKSHKIGLYSCTEHEFSIAGENSAGAHLSLIHISEPRRTSGGRRRRYSGASGIKKTDRLCDSSLSWRC